IRIGIACIQAADEIFGKPGLAFVLGEGLERAAENDATKIPQHRVHFVGHAPFPLIVPSSLNHFRRGRALIGPHPVRTPETSKAGDGFRIMADALTSITTGRERIQGGGNPFGRFITIKESPRGRLSDAATWKVPLPQAGLVPM